MCSAKNTVGIGIGIGMSSRNMELISVAMERTSEWVSSQEVPTDVIVRVNGASFLLHKLPLVSKSGYMRKLLLSDAESSAVEIHHLPGGAEAFDLAAKFCYGVNFEMSVHNVAMLRCVAEHLEMTEEFAEGNLVGRAESYLSGVALCSLSGALSVLIASQNMLPVAENVRVVLRCVDAVSFFARKEAESWWAQDLARLKIEFFQRVVVAMMARGLEEVALGPVLMVYAQKTMKVKESIDPMEEQEKRLALETIVSLLPKGRSALPVSFLSALLRSSIQLGTTIACRIDLERRMGLQLDQAGVDDLLIASDTSIRGALFDVDTAKRIMMNYFKYAEEERPFRPVSELERVCGLIEYYLVEIGSDQGLSASEFSGLVELVPKQSRVSEDGLYRAIDIFLKAHPNSSEVERKKLCSLMDCRKLSEEGRAHAAQNERLPVETAVQLIYHEQQRLREAMATDGSEDPSELPMALQSISSDRLASNEIVALRRENDELKMELLVAKMRVKEIKRSPDGRPPLPRRSLLYSVSRMLGKLNPLVRVNSVAPSANARAKSSRNRRHSIS